jgi:hypothetical protein
MCFWLYVVIHIMHTSLSDHQLDMIDEDSRSRTSQLQVAVRVRPILKSGVRASEAHQKDIMRVVDQKMVVVLDPDDEKVRGANAMHAPYGILFSFHVYLIVIVRRSAREEISHSLPCIVGIPRSGAGKNEREALRL